MEMENKNVLKERLDDLVRIKDELSIEQTLKLDFKARFSTLPYCCGNRTGLGSGLGWARGPGPKPTTGAHQAPKKAHLNK
jgi:hypothetical protein